LDTRLGIAENDLVSLKERMTKAEEKLDDFALNYKTDIYVRGAKKACEQERNKKEARKNE
jgi:hypothetical protein